jgi:hypothetical protein
MSISLNYKKPIPGEKETRANILTTAAIIGCQQQVKNIFNFYDGQLANEKNDPTARQKIAEECILTLFNLDQRLVSWLLNDRGEIVVGNKIVAKVTNKMNLF